MAGNTFGKLFCVTSFGESHGPAMGCVVDGCPAGLPLSKADIQAALDLRKPGQSRFTSQRREPDLVEILSGVFEGQTLGTPILLLIKNTDARQKDYEDLKTVFRPGHGDYTYQQKYGIRDWRGGGRQSARETLSRVAAGAIAQKFLAQHHISVRGCLTQIGEVAVNTDHFNWENVSQNPFFSPDQNAVSAFESLIESTLKAGDSLGAKVYVEAEVPAGLGEPVFNRLDADLAQALMSINASKAVEIGDGVGVVTQLGSQHRDEITPEGFLSNHSGGVLSGISTGQTLRVCVSFKPTSSIRKPARSINLDGEPVSVVTTGRHDPCVGIRAVPICVAMVALVLMDHYLISFGSQSLVKTGV